MARINSSSSGGSVNIQDSAGNPITSTGGAVNVNVVSGSPAGNSVSVYNEVTGIAIGASATVLSYTVPAGVTFSLTRIDYSSDSKSVVEIDFNGTTNSKRRLYFTDYNTIFEYSNQLNGFSLAAGTVITVVATNGSVQGVASFNATLQGVTQ